MTNFRKGNISGGPVVWYVNNVFSLIDRWDNLATPLSDRRFVLRLPVGPVDEGFYDRIDEYLVPRATPIRPFFWVDTGAETTLIGGRLAKWLELRLDGKPIDVSLPGGRILSAVRTEVRVNLGDDWPILPCVVPWPLEANIRTQNLLGMEGLLERHIFCIARNEMHLFRR
jgi:hypothetical protein